ncbi:MAG: ABC transporter permease [Gemmatimonadales bacterium]
MAGFVARRIYQAAIVMFAVATLTFFLIHLAPGDPFTPLAESSTISPETIQQLRRNFGLDEPIHVQYLKYLQRLVQGDLGISFKHHRPVLDVFRDVIPNTILLAVAAVFIDFSLGIATGIYQGTRSRGRADTLLSGLSLAFYATPVFWLGIMLILTFGVTLRWLPIAGATDPVIHDSLSGIGRLWDRLQHLIMPALTLGLVGAGGTARFQRSALIETLSEDYIRTARAKGLRERSVVLVHALRNSLLSVITLFGLSLPLLLSGAVLVETVFSWPGMGRLITDSVSGRDYPIVTAAAILSAAMVVAGSLAADVLYQVVDPRTRDST